MTTMPPSLSDTYEDAIWLRIARGELARLFGAEPAGRDVSAIADIPAPVRMNLTLRVDGAVRGSVAGRGKTLLEQVPDAVRRAALATRFGAPIVAAELDRVALELWMQIGSSSLPCEARVDPKAFVLGVDGVEVECGAAFAYYKPSVALTSGYASPVAMYRALCRKAGLAEDAWQDAACDPRKTTWVHLSEGGDAACFLLSGLRPVDVPEPDVSLMRAWVRDGAAYLANNQRADGHYCYIYHPLAGKDAGRPIHLVRAAGCAYAMAQAASTEQVPEARERWRGSAERCADALLSRALPFGEGGILIPEHGATWGQLGTAALLAIALSQPAMRDRYRGEQQQLLNTIRDAQRPDGTFMCRLGGPEGKEQADYFPGQALLALALAAQRGDRHALALCRRAFGPYRQHFRQNPHPGFVLWQADAWWRIAVAEDDSAIADFVFELIDWILLSQVGPEGPVRHRGGFSTGGSPGVASTVYTEAVVRAAGLARRLGDERRWSRYQAAARAGLRFCAQLVIGREHRPFLPQPERAHGGVTGSLTSFEVRCDNVQHLMTLAQAVLEEPSLL